MRVQIAPVSAGDEHHIFASLEDTLKKAAVPGEVLKAGFAYATLGGVQDFIAHVQGAGRWMKIPKQFLIGIHHAITEPSALNILMNTSASETRVFLPGNKLGMDALIAKPLFHPKVLAIGNKSGSGLHFLQAGSANLTSSAIGSSPQNYEFSISLTANSGSPIDRDRLFSSWWSGIWGKSRAVDAEFIRKYADIRKQALEQNPILRFATEPPASISQAEYFFSEVGAASGPPGLRHQIEFPESLARFFGPVKRGRRDLELRRGGKAWTGRPLSHKETTYEVEIWRLGMPTQSTGGDPIAERAIRFKRTSNPNAFDFEIADVPSATFAGWVRAANIAGHLGATHGQRARVYGFY